VEIFFYFDTEKSLPIEEIKECVKRMALLGKKISMSLSESDKNLSEDITRLSITMFAKKKAAVKTFTVLNSKKLAKMRVDEGNGEFTVQDIMILNNFFNDNPDAFSQLVVYSYLDVQILSLR
jgi:hypothetical protein